MRSRFLTIVAVFLVLTMVNSGSLTAQSGTSCALTGIVADKTGAVVPNAQVQATDVNTGAIRTAGSNVHIADKPVRAA